MPQLSGSPYRIQFGIKGWAALVGGLAIFIAVATALVIGFFFVVLPMIVLPPGADTIWNYRRDPVARIVEAVRALLLALQ